MHSIHFADVTLCVGIEGADVSLAVIIREYVDVSITVERCVDDVDFTVREEDATSFELVATPRIDVAAGSSRGYSGGFPSFPVVVLLVRSSLDSSLEALPFYTSFRSCNWLVEEREVAAVRVLHRPGCEGERRYRTLISLLGLLATMRRVVNYHSSWARQQQVELFDASGNPGFTAGRGFNPAGGATGGG
ncbi:hypothetical protein F511_34806 [Dorcoceras hygrometricum]|uniref:Uncharacterized protein n=1 Tax=Dorcoceras hygrometricum TaxID=472368 RepID=A0A2Z7CQT9_9LAMI|nr:hypothetical protein F511_34806 [Dorcoceras hygrometricum]